ncbi:uncharacterized protein MELLADRAFT_61257 [Melampsora larici-populina 98AG31]|uniref:Uncharacterized protein n=1 Tax=Melampsora larici-populina (strain 98AG31 / pathotype 3-4-7) TaxID=747676 RepID=F4RE78_MELLP|nr:uncharacterized protein MELLADRAFT_61257 [Melampsora larici-populina 98AG31]EGG09045.1 hypothetical protein MELLADRAFT_61257 [Melampsora larici-populina 98AG31]
MGQKGCVIKCPLGPKAKKQRTQEEPVGSSSQAVAVLSAVETQSALANADKLNTALMENDNSSSQNRTLSRPAHEDYSTFDAELNQPFLDINQSDGSHSQPSSPTNTDEPRTPQVNMTFGEYIRGAY